MDFQSVRLLWKDLSMISKMDWLSQPDALRRGILPILFLQSLFLYMLLFRCPRTVLNKQYKLGYLNKKDVVSALEARSLDPDVL